MSTWKLDAFWDLLFVLAAAQQFEVGSIGGSGAAAAEAPWQHDMPSNDG